MCFQQRARKFASALLCIRRGVRAFAVAARAWRRQLLESVIGRGNRSWRVNVRPQTRNGVRGRLGQWNHPFGICTSYECVLLRKPWCRVFLEHINETTLCNQIMPAFFKVWLMRMLSSCFTVGMNSQSRSRLILVCMASCKDRLHGPRSNGSDSSISQ